MNIALALKLLSAANETTALVAKAVEAANNDDDAAADDFLEQARSHFDDSRTRWDDAER